MVLASSPAEESKDDHDDDAFCQRISFGPGDEVLVKKLAPASDRPLLAEMAGIGPRHLDKWLVCVPLDRCGSDKLSTSASTPTLRLEKRLLEWPLLE